LRSSFGNLLVHEPELSIRYHKFICDVLEKLYNLIDSDNDWAALISFGTEVSELPDGLSISLYLWNLSFANLSTSFGEQFVPLLAPHAVSAIAVPDPGPRFQALRLLETLLDFLSDSEPLFPSFIADSVSVILSTFNAAISENHSEQELIQIISIICKLIEDILSPDQIPQFLQAASAIIPDPAILRLPNHLE
jgi:hypothetical protein